MRRIDTRFMAPTLGRIPDRSRPVSCGVTRPTARVLALLEILQAGGTRTVAELAERLAVDERTVRRYVAHLVDLDIPVRSVRGRYGGYPPPPRHPLPPPVVPHQGSPPPPLGPPPVPPVPNA